MRGITGLLLLLLVTASFATATTDQFAKDTIAAKCNSAGVQAVYSCNGDVVKVVWNDSTKGSTFYNPDGRVTDCPPGTPVQMGVQCLQYLSPNYCPGTSACGSSAPQIFPGQTSLPQQNSSTNVTPTAPAPAVTPAPQPAPSAPQNNTPKNNTIVETGSPAYPANVDSSFNNLILVLVVIAIAAIILLFTMFRSSLHT